MRHVYNFHRAQIVRFVSFAGAFASKQVVKSVKETCKTVHSIPKETPKASQSDLPYKTACIEGVKETSKEANESEAGLCKCAE